MVEAKRRRKRRIEHPRVEPIAPITVILAERPWNAGKLTLSQQLHERPGEPFRGEGLLMRANTDQLRAIFRTIVREQGQRAQRPWTEQEQQLVLDVADFASETHQGQTRKYDDTPYEHHLLRIGARAAQLEIGNPYLVAVALLHDAPEDHGVTLESMITYFRDRKGYDITNGSSPFNLDTFTMLFVGANALNMKRPDKSELSTKEYYRNIRDTNQQYPELHLWLIKGLDRLDNLIADISPAIRHKEIDKADKIRKADARKIKETIEEKMLPVIRQVRKNDSNIVVLSRMDHALKLGASLIREQGLTIKRGFVAGLTETLFMRGTAFTHVPA